MQRHLLVTVFQINPISKRVVPLVVVGSGSFVDASNEEPHVIALVAVPVMAIQSVCPSVGVPERLVVMDVMSTASAVMEKKSTLSVLIVGVALEATVPVRGVIRLLVAVCVSVVPSTVPLGAVFAAHAVRAGSLLSPTSFHCVPSLINNCTAPALKTSRDTALEF